MNLHEGPISPRKARALARIVAVQDGADGAYGADLAPERRERMSAEERREQVLAAAARAFSLGGYAGTTTDDVAKEAGVSQPYVVRMFGSKEQLFLAVFRRAVDDILAAFHTELNRIEAEGELEPDSDELWAELGASYLELVADRTVVLLLLHGFSISGAEPTIGRAARDGMGEIYAALRDRTGATPERIQAFVGHGMLLNVLMAMQAERAEVGTPLAEFATWCFGPDLGAELAGPRPGS